MSHRPEADVPAGRTGGADGGLLPPRRDVLLAALLCVGEVVVISPALTIGIEPVTLFLLVAGFVPLAWRRRAPRAVLALICVQVLLAALLAHEYAPVINVLAAVYTLAAERGGRESAVGAVVAYGVFAPVLTKTELSTSNDDRSQVAGAVTLALLMAFFVGCAWAAGSWAGRSRRRIDSLERRRLRAAAEAAEAAANERRRIARELHDIVSHSVSVMVLQAAGAQRVLERDPERAQAALAQIETVGKQSMTELRRMLGVLGEGSFADPRDGGDLTRQPGLADLPALMSSLEGSGLVLRSEVQGNPVPLDASVDLSAYRIAQEALTNAAKHSGPGTQVTVRQIWTDDLLLLEITDDGAGTPHPALSTGHGLVGLRERARAVEGQFEAGSTPDGGFRVSARLPVTRAAAGGRRDAREPLP